MDDDMYAHNSRHTEVKTPVSAGSNLFTQFFIAYSVPYAE